MTTKVVTQLPVIYLSHGGGPWPWMQSEYGDHYDQLRSFLEHLPATFSATPKTILLISAHWEARDFAVCTAERPGMLYDYGGFPPHTYKIVYPANGNPTIAAEVIDLARKAGIACDGEPSRGFDHATFVPLYVMYPKADIAVVQFSLRKGLDPSEHLAIGRALSPLRSKGVLVLASGFSYHNLQRFDAGAKVPSTAFDQWLQKTVCSNTADARSDLLKNWQAAPHARDAHPRAEHLLPLMVAAGAGYEDSARCIYHEVNFFGGITSSAFQFG